MPKEKKNQVISGMVHVPEDIASMVEKSKKACDVTFMMTPEFLFRGENNKPFNLKARLQVNGTIYYIAKEVGGESLTIGFGDVKPDTETEREIKQLYAKKS